MKPFYWLGMIFSEADGNGGKASFSRFFGALVILEIQAMAWREKPAPDVLYDMFMILVGYALLSKVLANPAILEIFKSRLGSRPANPPENKP